MTKLTTIAFVLLATSLGQARAAPFDGKPVPLFPKLTWGLAEPAAVSQGLETYKRGDRTVVGLASTKVGGVDFAAQAAFGKGDGRDGRSGLASILLQHEGAVPTQQYYKFLRIVTSGFIYAGRGSAIDESAVFYDAIKGDSHLVVTSSDSAKISLSVEIGPGRSK